MKIKVEVPHCTTKFAIVFNFSITMGAMNPFLFFLVLFLMVQVPFTINQYTGAVLLIFLLSTLRSSKTMDAIPTSEEAFNLLWSIRGLQKTTDNFLLCINVKFWKIIKPVL